MILSITSPRLVTKASWSHREAQVICRVTDTAGNKPFGTEMHPRGIRE